MRVKVLCLIIMCISLLLCHAVAEEARPLLTYNSKGEAVRELQERLAELGYYTYRITGVYQENTQKAVRAFQKDHGLLESGIADDTLQRMILDPLTPSKPKPTPPPIAMDVAFPGIVQYGSTSDHVKRIQTRLYQLGFYEKNITGTFGKETQSAVRAFQTQNGLVNDGVVGKDTWQALFFTADPVDASATPRPTPAPTPQPYRLTIDLTNQVTTVYGLDENGDYTTLVRQMICSTGTDSDPTPIKTFVLNGRRERWAYFPKWGSYAQYWTRLDSLNAFHSVIYRSVDEMALATGSYTGLGKKASHGCVRLMIDDAKWIYDNCGKGTEVVSFNGEPDPELTQSLRVPKLDHSRMLPVPTPGPTPKPDYSSDMLPETPFQTLRKGTESEAVYWLQMKLTEKGYYHGSVTGGYYDGTVQAVRAFQRDHGLSVDGVAGKQTQSKLYEELLATPSPSPVLLPSPTASPSLSDLLVLPTSSASPSISPTQSILPSNTPAQYSPTATATATATATVTATATAIVE